MRPNGAVRKSHRDSITYRLNLPRINLNNSDTCGNKFLAQALSETAHGGFCSAVDRVSRKWVSSSDRADIDNIALAAIKTPKEDGNDWLSHINKADDICVEHDAYVFLDDLWDTGGPLSQATDTTYESAKS